MSFFEFVLQPLIIGPLGYILGIITDQLLKDQMHPFLHKKRSLEILKSQVKPQVSAFTIRTIDDLQLFSKRVEACNKLYKGEMVVLGVSHILTLEKITAGDIDITAGNCRLIHIENFSDYGCNIKEICDANKNPVFYKCPDLSYVERKDSIGIVINAYITLSKICVDFNGHVFMYPISERDGSINPIIK